MDFKVTTLAGKDAGQLSLSDEIFGLDPRDDILARVIRWQLAARQQGTHVAKGRADIARTGVDVISVGKLTHSAGSLDLGLDALDQA